jgi:hypothetical protein
MFSSGRSMNQQLVRKESAMRASHLVDLLSSAGKAAEAFAVLKDGIQW